MQTKKRLVALSRKEKETLKEITKKGIHPARVIKRAHALLRSEQGWKDKDIASSIEISKRTVENIRSSFAEGGMNRALYDAQRSGQPKKLTEKSEAHLVALACSEAPEGYDHWTLELLQKQMVKDKQVKTVTTVTLWNYLMKRAVKPWREKNVVRSESHSGIC